MHEDTLECFQKYGRYFGKIDSLTKRKQQPEKRHSGLTG